MKDLVIGDVHFGIKSNSTRWLDQMVEFFNAQIEDTINEEKPDRVIFLGDLFDVRYSTNTLVGCTVKRTIRNLLEKHALTKFYFIAGNHDFYSPLEEFIDDNVYDMIFGKEFEYYYDNVKFVVKEPFESENELMMPWYSTEDKEMFLSTLEDYNEAKVIYCHSDLQRWDQDMLLAVAGRTVISGHIHYPWIDKTNNLYNVGACLQLTFNDVNSSRYVYIVEDGKIVKKIENIITPKFKRWHNEQIFTLGPDDFKNSFCEFYISKILINKAKYIEQIKKLKQEYVGTPIRVQTIDEDYTIDSTNIDFNKDINKYIDDNIPDYLQDKYEKVKESINQTNKK